MEGKLREESRGGFNKGAYDRCDDRVCIWSRRTKELAGASVHLNEEESAAFTSVRLLAEGPPSHITWWFSSSQPEYLPVGRGPLATALKLALNLRAIRCINSN